MAVPRSLGAQISNVLLCHLQHTTSNSWSKKVTVTIMSTVNHQERTHQYSLLRILSRSCANSFHVHPIDQAFRKIPWRRKWQPAPVFFPGKFQGQGNLVGYSPWGHKESDMTEHTHTRTHRPDLRHLGTPSYTDSWEMWVAMCFS